MTTTDLLETSRAVATAVKMTAMGLAVRLAVEPEPRTHMTRQDKPAELNPAGMVEIAHPQTPEVEAMTPTARQHRLAVAEETVMAPPSRVAVAEERMMPMAPLDKLVELRAADTETTATTQASAPVGALELTLMDQVAKLEVVMVILEILEILEAWVRVIPTAALNKVEVRPPAVQVDMEGVWEALTSKSQAVTEVAARTIAATPETKIPQPADS